MSRLAVLLLLPALVAPSCSGAPSASRHPGDARARIVVMAPAAAEMIDALGAADRVVGVGDFVRDPPALAALPRVGSYDAPSIEQVLALEADLLITTSSQAGATAHRRLASLGVRVLSLDTSTFQGVFTSIEEVGRALGREAQALALSERIRGELRSIEQQAAPLDARRVLFVVGRDPLYVAGPGSHADEMISLAGGRNVAHDAVAPYQRVSLESILERMPEVIIDGSDNRPGALRGRHAGEWERWAFLPAVADRRVYHVDPSRLAIPGVRLAEMTRLMARLIHPEVFGEPRDEELGLAGP